MHLATMNCFLDELWKKASREFLSSRGSSSEGLIEATTTMKGKRHKWTLTWAGGTGQCYGRAHLRPYEVPAPVLV
jgi:hypothetical protein